MDEYGVMFYDVNPHSTTDANLMSTGPFASDSYSPLSYDDTYWFYLDGMEDLNGWYTAQGSDAEVALKAALDEAGIPVLETSTSAPSSTPRTRRTTLTRHTSGPDPH